MKQAEYKSNERLFVLANELETLNKALITLNLSDNERISIMRAFCDQRGSAE